MKSTEKFKEHIENFLINYADNDNLFKARMNNPKKSVEKCCEYIISEVKKSGRTAFADEEIYGMAVHYYDEENITYKKVSCGNIVGPYELTEQEKADAREKAIKQYQDDLVNQMKNPAKPTSKGTANTSENQMSLF